MLAIIFNVLYKVIVGYFAGKILLKFLKWEDRKITMIPFGYLAYMGILELISYIIMTLGCSTRLCLILCFGSGLAIVIAAFVLHCSLKPTKYDWIGLLVGGVVCGLFVWRTSSYNVGADAYDSVWYLSMVIENAKASSFGIHTMQNYYLGVPAPEAYFRYGLQMFYALESMIIKLVVSLGLYKDALTTPIYLWGTTCSFGLFFGMMVTNTGYLLFSKRKVAGLVWITLSSIICVMYFTYVLAFIGNSWRGLAFACFLYVLYECFKEHDYSHSMTIILGILLTGTIAFSSSCAFIILFLMISILVANIYNHSSEEQYTTMLIVFAFVIPYLAIQYWQFNPTVTVALVAVYSMYCLLYHQIRKKHLNLFFKVHRIVIPIVLIGIVIYSYFIQKNSLYPYAFFFDTHSRGDMNYDFLRFTIDGQFYFPTFALWFLVAIYLLFSKENKDFKCSILWMLLIFLNPLTMPFVIQYLSDFVYYRAYDAVFNIFTIGVFVSVLGNMKTNIIASLVLCYWSYLFGLQGVGRFMAYHTNGLTPKDPTTFNGFYRLEANQADVLEVLNTEVSGLSSRPLILSQITSLKGYIANCRLQYIGQFMSGIYKYDEEKPPVTDELLNIFGLRDYAEQQLYATPAQYDQANDLILASGFDYLVLATDQYKVVDGEYVPVFFDIRAIADTIYMNDGYVILKVRHY